MFNFATTTIINSDTDVRSDKALFSSIDAGDKHGAILRIKRDFTFEMPYIQKVYKRVAAEAVPAQVTVNCAELIKALPANTIYPLSGRIGLYVALEGSEESVFANDFYQKGLPFSIGYCIKSADVTATELGEQIAKTANKFNLATVGRRLFDVTAKAGVVTFKCTDEYMRFKAVVVLTDLGDSEEEVVHLFDGEQGNTQTVITVVNRGTNGFGTFRHLVKDLRLPTAMNTNWTALRQSERPVPGALYNQYIIYYKAPSGTNPSLVAVGHETKSKTAHVFWVRQDYATAFEAVVAKVVGAAAVKNDPTAIFEEV